ncbi:ATP-binding protein [Chloroflexota bacterium]
MRSIGQILAKSAPFEDLTDSELDKIVALCREEVYEDGATIFREDEPANEFYVVAEGRIVLEMTIRIGLGSRRQGAIEAIIGGDVFGWTAIAGLSTYTMSARCIEETKVVTIDRTRLLLLFEEDHHIAHKVMKKLLVIVSARVQKTRDTLAHVLSIASHDLKSPIAAVESYLQVILGGYTGEITEKQRNMLSRSSERLKLLLRLIDNVLDISRIDTRELKMVPTSLPRVAQSALEIIQPLAQEKKVQLKFDVPEDLPMVIAAPNQIQQVIANLLGNAMKFTPSGGEITLNVHDEDSRILVEVMDTGIGISHEELPKIFDDFYRGNAAETAGAGLGLSIAKRVIEAHNGKIWVESPCPESGVGSKFSFILPKNLEITQSENKRGI